MSEDIEAETMADDQKQIAMFGRMSESEWKNTMTKQVIVFKAEITNANETIRATREELVELRLQIQKNMEEVESNTVLLKKNISLSNDILKELRDSRVRS